MQSSQNLLPLNLRKGEFHMRCRRNPDSGRKSLFICSAITTKYPILILPTVVRMCFVLFSRL